MSMQPHSDSKNSPFSLLEKGQTLLAKGKLHAAAAHLHRVVQISGPRAAAANLLLAQLHYEWNDLDNANHFLQRAATLREPDAGAGMAVAIRRLQARLHQIQGHEQSADSAMSQATEFAGKYHLIGQQRINAANAAWLALYRGDFRQAKKWIHRIGPLKSITHADVFFTITQWRLTQNDRATARDLLRSRLANQLRRRPSPHLVSLLVLEAATAGTNGLPIMSDALTLAEPEGYVRSFLDRGALILPTLQAAADQTETAAYARRLLTHFHNQPILPASPPPVAADAVYTGTTPLTAQELMVLRLVVNQRSYEDIAATLGLTREEVRQHVRTLHKKLAPQEINQ